jgi:DNA polymerase-3 subunit gamma/tau
VSQEVAPGAQEQATLIDLPAQSSGGASEESAQVLYRKWRPQSFAQVVGQEPVTRTLRNSVASGRLAHAYLLTGPRGTGKTSLGRLIAKAANCPSPADGEPCGQCDSCRAFLAGRAIDFIEQDAASHNSVEDIRQLRENVTLSPMSGRYKVYLLDEVHMLSKGAENALLKTLEEPPRHIIFVLATTEPHKVESTIISRCQRFDLRRIAAADMVGLLARICEKEGFQLDQAALAEVARGAGGSLRDAINGLEQIVTYYGPSPTLDQVREALGISVDARSADLARLALRGDLTESLKLVAAVRDDGVDISRFSKEVVGYLRGLLLVKSGAADTLDETKETIADMQPLAKQADGDRIVQVLKTLGKLDFRDDPQSSLPLELALVELASQQTPAASPPPSKAEAKPPSPAPERPARLADTAPPPPTDEPAGPQPEPSQPAPAVDGVPPDLLSRVREACKESDKQLAALLNQSCEVTSLQDDVITLGFYHTFHLERVEAGGYASRMGELISQQLRRTVKVRLEHAPRRPTPGKVKGGHLVQAARELGAKPIDNGPTNDPGMEV